MRDLDWSDVLADADRMQTAYEDEQRAAWEREHPELAAAEEEEAYQWWAEHSGYEDTSREAYASYLDWLLPDD